MQETKEEVSESVRKNPASKKVSPFLLLFQENGENSNATA